MRNPRVVDSGPIMTEMNVAGEVKMKNFRAMMKKDVGVNKNPIG